jgi:hypothetical protein
MRLGLTALAIAALACGQESARTDAAEIAPAGELQTLGAESRPTIRLRPEAVPAELRDLIPFAEQWGIGDDVIRSDVERKSSDAEKQRFKAALTGRTTAVTAWLDSFGEGAPMSDEAAAFMYMLEALDEMQHWPD